MKGTSPRGTSSPNEQQDDDHRGPSGDSGQPPKEYKENPYRDCYGAEDEWQGEKPAKDLPKCTIRFLVRPVISNASKRDHGEDGEEQGASNDHPVAPLLKCQIPPNQHADLERREADKRQEVYPLFLRRLLRPNGAGHDLLVNNQRDLRQGSRTCTADGMSRLAALAWGNCVLSGVV